MYIVCVLGVMITTRSVALEKHLKLKVDLCGEGSRKQTSNIIFLSYEDADFF